jgi:hypothetical protein
MDERREATFVVSSGIRTPMGGGMLAYREPPTPSARSPATRPQSIVR